LHLDQISRHVARKPETITSIGMRDWAHNGQD